MHIGFITHVNLSQVTEFLFPEDAKRAEGLIGAQNTPLSNTLPAWLETGHTISIFSFESGVSENAEFHGNSLSIYLVPVKKSKIPPWLRWFRYERKRLVPEIRRVAPDVLLSQWIQTGHSLAALDTGLPCVCTIRATPLRYVWEGRSWRPSAWVYHSTYLLMALAVIKRSSRLIAVSKYTEKHIRKYFRFKRPVHVVGNPVLFGKTNQTLRRHPYDPDIPVFIDISGWNRVKNTKRLLRSFSAVRKVVPQARLILYGQDLHKGGKGYFWAEKHSLNENVDFRGFASREELNRALVEDADIFVHLSIVETFGNTIFEAIASGIPVLISAIGAAPEILKYHESFLYINPYDIEAAKDGMLELVGTYERRLNGIDDIVQRLSAEYSPAGIVKQLENVLSEACRDRA